MVTQITDYEDRAQARLPEQFKGKDLITALVRAFANETQDLEDAVFPMLDLLDISTMIGAQLDGIGDILTEPRDGKSDADYRIALNEAAAAITGSGTPEQVIERFIALTAPAGDVKYLPAFPAGYCIGSLPLTHDDTQDGAPVGQVITLVTGGLGAVDAYAGGYANAIISDSIWEEVAPQLGAETRIWSLAVFNNKLYGSTGTNGRLFEWNGTDAWVQVAPQLGAATNILSLAVYNNKLYGGANPGQLYEWNDADAWVEVAPVLGGETAIYALAVFNNKLYGSTGTAGKLFEWNDVDAWVEVAPQQNSQTRVYSLAVYNNKLYGGTYVNGNLFEWNNVDAWVQVAPMQSVQSSILSLAVYNNKLYGGTAASGKLFEWNDVDAWVEVAPQLNGQLQVHALAVYNNKLYGGMGNDGRLFEWNDADAWVEVAPKLGAEANMYALAVFNNKLYCGTWSLGKLYEWGGSATRAIVSNTDDTVELAGALTNWADGGVLFLYSATPDGDVLAAMEGASAVGVYVGLLDLLALEDNDLFLLEDGDTMYVTYDSSGR